MWRTGFLFLVICGFHATILGAMQAMAAAPPLPLTLTAQRPEGEVFYADTGASVRLFGIAIPYPALFDGATMWHRWTTMPLIAARQGSDRYGNPQLRLYHPTTGEEWAVALLQEGLAIVYPTQKEAVPALFWAAEAQARKGHRGYWASPSALRNPADETSLRAQQGQLVVLQGRITQRYTSREAIFLHFGTDWKTDSSVVIPRRLWRACAPFLADTPLQDAPVKPIEVRGVITEDHGPSIHITHPDQLQWMATSKGMDYPP